jgi:tetratricopeptide (TPR) repeat protein
MVDLKNTTAFLRDPARDGRQVEAIQDVVRAGDIPRAVQMACAALDTGLIHPMLLNLRAHGHDVAGRLADALSDLRIAFQIDPEDIYVRNALGLLLARMGYREEAGPMLAQTAMMAPGFAPAHYSLGWFQAFTGDVEGARRSFVTTIALHPDMPEALAHLASLASDQADWPETERYAALALAIQPRQPVALTARAAAAVAQGHLEDAEAALKPLGNLSALPPLEAVRANTVMGDLRHAQGRYDEAFEIYAARNRETFRRAAPNYDHVGNTATDHVDRLRAHLGGLPDGAWTRTLDTPAAQGPARTHVFLVGFPRSGTTLAESALAAHPDIAVMDEREALMPAASEYLMDGAGLVRLAQAPLEDLENCRARYWENVRGFGVNAENKVFVDKYPLNTIKLPLIARLFPQARILVARRDPRDVLLSCFRRSFALNAAMFEFLDLQRAARFYDAVMALASECERVLDQSMHVLRYESLLADFDGEMGRTCAFLGLPFNDRIRDFAALAKTRAIRTPSGAQVSRGLYSNSKAQWERYEAQIAQVMPILAPWVEKFGYQDSAA